MTATTDAPEFSPEPSDVIPIRSRRPIQEVLARMRRVDEVGYWYRAWIAREVTLEYVKTVLDLTDEEGDTLYRGRDNAMRIDRLGKVTYDEPTLLRAVCAVVGD